MIPNTINQGDSLSWTESENDYPASEGWIIGYNLVITNKRINFESTADGDSHSFNLTATTTGEWTPGAYTFQRYATDATQRITISRGSVDIKQDLLTASDQRSQAQKTLDSIEAVIEGRATLDQEGYSIGGRSLTRMNITDLIAFRDTYRAEVAREKNAQKLAQGLCTKQTIRVRF